jgi:hypothetical protein
MKEEQTGEQMDQHNKAGKHAQDGEEVFRIRKLRGPVACSVIILRKSPTRLLRLNLNNPLTTSHPLLPGEP